MKKNASVFTSGIRLNKAVRDFSCDVLTDSSPRLLKEMPFKISFRAERFNHLIKNM